MQHEASANGAVTQRLWTIVGLAEYLGVPVATVYRWNYRGTGPRPRKIGKHVRYRDEDVAAWIASQ